MTPPPTDAAYLRAAAALALRGRPAARPNPSVGCLIVRDGRIVGRGWTAAGGRPHAEAQALRQAGRAARGATVYVTLEPCAHSSPRGPACADILAEAGPGRVVIACRDPDPRTAGSGAERLRAAGIAVDWHPCEAAAETLSAHRLHHTAGRPHVTVKLALSLDGRIALPSGASRWITGEAARRHVHRRRALADAILVGGETWRRDRPRLDVRLAGLEAACPVPVVLSREPVAGVRTIAAPAGIAELGGVRWLYVEGGGRTVAAFLAADLVDRLELYRAPIVVGDGVPAVGDLGLRDLSAAHGRWRLTERAVLGEDGFEAYRRVRTASGDDACSPES